ncbi:hypothetical protein C8R46DRAFT_1043759 [Mycena filopes]|nr:hypothetical protein C8R46DRAFT_1043759 [Mycena filopes]
MATNSEQDCVSFQAPDSPVLSTPELTSPSSCAFSADGSEDSFFSARSSNIPSASITWVPEPNLVPPQRVEFPRKISRGGSRPPPLPLDDFTIPSSLPIPGRPGKLRKSRPYLPILSLESPIPASSTAPSSPQHQSTLTSPIRASVVERGRRASLPTIPSATLPRNHNHEEIGINLRAVRFLAPLGASSIPLRRPRTPHPTRKTSTHVLVSLAWTGQIPLSPRSAVTSAGSELVVSTPSSASRSTWSEEEEDILASSLPLSQRPLTPGRCRRWSLAMAVTNNNITDEMFVNEVENMRTRATFWESQPSAGSPSQTINSSLHSLSGPLLSATWRTARKALLICRELIRTERNYLSSLLALVSNGTSTPPPPLMLTYLPALVQTSEDLLLKMEANPSAQGVAQAFIDSGSRLETAFVAWCGVSASFFVGADEAVCDAGIAVPLKRRVTTWVRKRRTSLLKNRGSTTGIPFKAPAQGRPLPSVRDLAILPTQRVMRYALLFRDLLANMPSTSPSHGFVGHALDVAVGVAQKSDRAQGNAAFLYESPGTHV